MSFDVSGSDYDRFMGPYARELAPAFADFAGVSGGRVLDVGCGSGILTEELARRVGEENVAAVDPSPMLETCRARVPGADLRTAAAEDLPWPDGTFDAALAQLVLHFLDDPRVGLAEMGRVVRPGGVVAASSWNFPKMPLLRTFWEVARDLVPTAPGETQYFEELEELEAPARDAGLDEVETAPLDVSRRYEGFAELWSNFELGVGPAGEFYGSLPVETRDALRDAYRERIGDLEGAFDLPGQAWAVRGRVPT
jgi:ubiquinone/menaquinone biosynthesis C-methylase UbiE